MENQRVNTTISSSPKLLSVLRGVVLNLDVSILVLQSDSSKDASALASTVLVEARGLVERAIQLLQDE